MNQGQGQQENEVENATLRRFRRLTVPITQESSPISISTRAIGFMLTRATRFLHGLPYEDYSSDDWDDESYQRETIKVPLSAMYRVSLAQLEAKVQFATSNQRLLFNPSVSHLYDLQPSPLLYSIMEQIKFSYHDMQSPVSAIINSIGHVKTNRMHYVPKFTKKITPLNIRISNLRKYCEDMANPNTPAEDRKTGYQLNSIPNAEWEENNLGFVLKNPDDIIAADYDRHSFSNDLQQMYEFLDIMRVRKRLLHHKPIDYESFGNPGILASTHVVPGQSLRLDERNHVDTNCEPTFWSREFLIPESWSIGVLTLTGELLNPSDEPHRSPMLAAEEHYGQWNNVCDIFVHDFGSRNYS